MPGTLLKADHSKFCQWHRMSGHDKQSCIVNIGTDTENTMLRQFPSEEHWFRSLQGPNREAAVAKMGKSQFQRLASLIAAVRREASTN